MIIHIIIPCRMDEKCAVSQLVYIDDHSYYNPMSNGRKVCWSHNLFILMIIHIIIPCRMDEKCAVSQLVYIDDHSYYSPMSNGRKVCWLTTCLY